MLRLARYAAGLSQAQLAGRAGVPVSMVSSYEREQSQPTLASLLRLLKAAGCLVPLPGGEPGFHLEMHAAPHDDHHDTRADHWFADSLELMASVAAERGQSVPAARMFGAAEALREALGLIRSLDQIADYEADLRSVLSRPELEAAWGQGATVLRHEALTLAAREEGETDASNGWSRLSDTERQIVELVAEGHTNREIGETLGISPRTVQSYLTRVFAKLHVTSRRQIRNAYRQRKERPAPGQRDGAEPAREAPPHAGAQ